MADCAFCEIVAGEAEAHVLYEDERTLAFLDQNPAVEGHSLVIPTDHRAELLDGDDAGAVFETVQTVSDGLDDLLQPDGFSLFYTTETLVGSVRHAHVHVLPRWADDDVSLALHRGRLDDDAAANLAAGVRDRARE